MIRIHHIKKAYRKALVLDDFSYTFQDGSSYGILGINGAGKSTLISCIMNNLKYSGTIQLEGLSRYEIGYVPQELAIYPELSVKDNLLFFATLYKVDKNVAKERAKELMERVDLKEKENTLAKELSGGMKRKLNLITGLIHQPKLLICDEVCVGIDLMARKEILESLKTLQKEGLQILYTSHYLDEVEFLCDKVLFIHEGKLILEGNTKELVQEIGGKKDSHLSDVFEKVMREKEE